jgi:MoxR-like ATPase
MAPESRPAFYPNVPSVIGDLGIQEGLVRDLFLRRIALDGQGSLRTLSRHLKVPVAILDPVFRDLRRHNLVEVKGMAGNDYNIVLSGAGHAVAAEKLQVSLYAGPAPVSLTDYDAVVKAQSAELLVTRETLRSAFGDLELTDALLDRLGPALIAQNSIFLYGPTGNGKTSLATRLLRVYHDAVLIPYSVEVDGNVVSVFDPVVHVLMGIEDDDVDPRWVVCRRPMVIAGGELVSEMLDLRLDETSRIYSAPLQMKANNGVLVVDDFGRQAMAPRELLNRWIVPLDRRVDYLALRYGVKFQIPFEVLVVFATNLNPRELADDAFLRRIHTKIYVDPVSPDIFDRILSKCARPYGIQIEPDTAETLRRLCLSGGRPELRACYPGDICRLLSAIAHYEQRAASATREDLCRAVDLYFAESGG